MCRSIKPLFNLEPASGEEDVRAAAVQFVRKISGYTKPSKVNQQAFNEAVDEISAAAQRLLAGLKTAVPPKPRQPAGRSARSERYDLAVSSDLLQSNDRNHLRDFSRDAAEGGDR